MVTCCFRKTNRCHKLCSSLVIAYWLFLVSSLKAWLMSIWLLYVFWIRSSMLSFWRGFFLFSLLPFSHHFHPITLSTNRVTTKSTLPVHQLKLNQHICQSIKTQSSQLSINIQRTYHRRPTNSTTPIQSVSHPRRNRVSYQGRNLIRRVGSKSTRALSVIRTDNEVYSANPWMSPIYSHSARYTGHRDGIWECSVLPIFSRASLVRQHNGR